MQRDYLVHFTVEMTALLQGSLKNILLKCSLIRQKSSRDGCRIRYYWIL